MARKKDERPAEEPEDDDLNPFSGPLEFADIPKGGSRTKWKIDGALAMLEEAFKAGRAVRAPIKRVEIVPQVQMSLRYGSMKHLKLRLRYRPINDKTLLLWTEKVKETIK